VISQILKYPPSITQGVSLSLGKSREFFFLKVHRKVTREMVGVGLLVVVDEGQWRHLVVAAGG
jgi:hypothetical protein